MSQVLVIYGVIHKLWVSVEKKTKKNDIPKYAVFTSINCYKEALTRSRSSLPGLK